MVLFRREREKVSMLMVSPIKKAIEMDSVIPGIDYRCHGPFS